MCTALTYKTKDNYFGRNLDLEVSFKESITITPRNFNFSFRKEEDIDEHFAIIGMATVVDNYPLYYDATNEKGLSMAGLNFPVNAYYQEDEKKYKFNITPFEFIPWILAKCSSVDEAENLIKNTNLIRINFSDKLPLAPLHWIISDSERSIVVEPMKSGLIVYDNPVGVMTNNPTFDFQLYNLNNYMGLSSENPKNRFSDKIDLRPYSKGMGGIGLPGDLSSVSRFVKAVFTKFNSVCGESENESVSQFFHILGSVDQQKGCNETRDGYEFTIYSSCVNTDKGIYYYKTYYNSQITAVDMHRENLDSDSIIEYPMLTETKIEFQN